MGRRRRSLIAGAVLGLLAGTVGAADDDARGLFQARCGKCHERAGPLVRETLRIEDSRLVRRGAGADLAAFLKRHPRGLSAAEQAAIYDALLAIAQYRGRFQESCAICHGTARELARDYLVLRDGALIGRYSGRDMAEYLPGHARMDAVDAAFFEDVLRRVTRSLARTPFSAADAGEHQQSVP